MPRKKIESNNLPYRQAEMPLSGDAADSENESAVSSGKPREARVVKRIKSPKDAYLAEAATFVRSLVEVNNVSQSFFDVDYNELDKDLSPEQLKEWTAIYASYRSKTPLTGTVIGVDTHRLAVTDPVTKAIERRQILCLVIIDFRVKVIVPQTEIWHDTETNIPDYVIKRMVGAKIDYIITNVDRPGDCAIASRRMALGYARNHFFRDSRRTEPGQIQTCNVLVVGPSRIIAECNGFDLQLRNRDLSYTAIADLRTEYRPGQELKAKLINTDKMAETMEVSIKEVNPNPFIGADRRHPVGSTRQAVISGSYAGGLFCRLSDDTTCLCLYSPSYFSEEFYNGDSVLIAITQYDYNKMLIYGRIVSKM